MEEGVSEVDYFSNFKVDRHFLHYHSPFTACYSSQEMSHNFSQYNRIVTWRKLWLYLAKAQQMLNVDITLAQIEDIKNNIYNINFEAYEEEAKNTRNDVMAHLKVFMKCCNIAGPIIGLGVSSSYITDNADLILFRDAFNIITPKLMNCIEKFCAFSEKYRETPTLSYIHNLPSQPTTVGKRAAIWGDGLYSSLQKIIKVKSELKLRGIKDISGTQASILRLFDGDKEKVKFLEFRICQYASFPSTYPLCTQIYPRIIDYDCIYPLTRLASIICKICGDIRLLCNFKEIEEMGRKSCNMYQSHLNVPVSSERCCSLARYLMNLSINPLHTASNQWLERSLDDCVNRRIVLAEAFIAADSLVETLSGLVDQLEVNLKIIDSRLKKEMPYLASNYLVSAMVSTGRYRNEADCKIQDLGTQSSHKYKDLEDEAFISNLLKDTYFSPIHSDIPSILDPVNFIGMSSHQVSLWLHNVRSALSKIQTSEPIKFVYENPHEKNPEIPPVVESEFDEINNQ
ncbi:ADSL [Cordylochernes scorpioides]|uniref:ADSL n=1 Tax=Cordylochernes scorpioides TaxID=51811 RepID=A0ABY6K8V3_9ARAC|nr:ADSL [Cordylochernes scorpioides]